MNIRDLIEEVSLETKMPILRPVDLELLKEVIMDMDEFKDVIVFNVLHERSEKIKTTLMDPKKDKFNSVVNIYSIHTIPSLDNGYALMVDCYEDTVLRS